MSSNIKFVCELGDATITTRELDILKQPDAWLNDSIITFYLEWCKLHSPRKDAVVLIQPTVSFMMRLLPPEDMVASGTTEGNPLIVAQQTHIRQVFVPVNNAEDPDAPGGSHWSLLVFDKDEDKLLHYDSSKGFNRSVAKQTGKCLVNILAPSRTTPPMFEEVRTAQQENSYDCGVYVLMNLRNMLFPELENKLINREAAQAFRKYLLDLIMQCSKDT